MLLFERQERARTIERRRMLSENACADNEELVAELSGVLLYKNGKVVRQTNCLYPNVDANACFVDGVASKDVVLNVEKNIWVRIYLPQPTAVRSLQSSEMKAGISGKMPILVFFHGGAFVMFSAATSIFDSSCRRWASELGAMVISVGYRLAPENRLPTAFDDAYFAIKWLQEQATSNTPEEWLNLHADFSSCFMMGVSSGACIAHQAALRSCRSDLSPMQIRGIILVVPFFGGTVRTSSELTYAHNDILTLHDSDTAWILSLPPGATRDHHYCNPLGPNSPDLKRFDLPPYLLIIGGKDPLHDRQMTFVEALRNSGKHVELLRYEDRGHFTPFPETDLIVFMERCLSRKESHGLAANASKETLDF
ncbi:hypothetical protein O6H91_15G001900 [Diphasiastrum complanatum]|uniref:Uncharacterized protein n=2 Tax=Diphasiastrum complanatum TaxID=34168 RepID=A0ACC2BF56_DIPCM|nr:hypothetical protein O6H91_15G001500 [Diphasiastrum complanatum]KAJ7528390.1 hypothetical protein O6H91_15G001900 [Diphasiastrum complanatum]